MALQLSIVDPRDGSTLETAYARVTAIAVDVARQIAAVQVTLHADHQARLDEREPVIIDSFTWDMVPRSDVLDPSGAVILPAWPTIDGTPLGAAHRDPVSVFAAAYNTLKQCVERYAQAIDV